MLAATEEIEAVEGQAVECVKEEVRRYVSDINPYRAASLRHVANRSCDFSVA